jgi:hypothetical protein
VRSGVERVNSVRVNRKERKVGRKEPQSRLCVPLRISLAHFAVYSLIVVTDFTQQRASFHYLRGEAWAGS